MGGRLALRGMLAKHQLSAEQQRGRGMAASSAVHSLAQRLHRRGGCVCSCRLQVRERSLLATFPTAGTPFWKLVLKQFDDLLVKVRQAAAGAAAGAAAETLLLAGQAPHAPHCPLLLHSATEAAACGLIGIS